MRVFAIVFLVLGALNIDVEVRAEQSAPTSLASQAKFEYTLGTGDKLRITVYQEEDLSGEYEIGGNGVISMPLVGEVKAAGQNVPNFIRGLREQLSQYLKNPKVNAEVINYRPFAILGEVKTPGQYPYVNGMTVLNAVALAGGFTYRANEREVTIKRAGTDKSYPADETTIVLPEDTIVVRERFF